MGKSKRKRRRRGGVQAGGRKGGALIGMRSGFKKVARSVGVAGEDKAQAARKKTWLSTAVTVLLVLAAAAVLYYRFG